MLYRYAGSPKANGSLDNFSDASTVSSYAVNAMQWAVANGIVNGSNGKLNPQNNATRAEVAAILMRFCEMRKQKNFRHKDSQTSKLWETRLLCYVDFAHREVREHRR